MHERRVVQSLTSVQFRALPSTNEQSSWQDEIQETGRSIRGEGDCTKRNCRQHPTLSDCISQQRPGRVDSAVWSAEQRERNKAWAESPDLPAQGWAGQRTLTKR